MVNRVVGRAVHVLLVLVLALAAGCSAVGREPVQGRVEGFTLCERQQICSFAPYNPGMGMWCEQDVGKTVCSVEPIQRCPG